MPPTNPREPRYLPTYRSSEINFVCDQAVRGESICFVGIAGCGKSNLINFLRENDDNKKQYLGDATDKVHFPSVDAAGWDGTPRTLWNKMNNALINVLEQMDVPADLQRGIPFDRLSQTLAWLCQVQRHRVMFSLDEFDDVFRQGPRSVFELLSTLRSDGNRERLSYLVFTRKLPHVLGRKHDLENRSKFYDLLRLNIYALPLHGPDDSRQMLLHLDDVARPRTSETLRRLDAGDIDELLTLSGGHARLIKVMYEAWPSATENAPATAESLAGRAEVQDECKRIILGLHGQETEAAVQWAKGHRGKEYETTINHLRRRGVIKNNDDWFSPIIGIYLREYF